MSGTGQGTLGEVWDGSGTIPDLWDGSRTLGEVGDELGDPRGGPGQVGGRSLRSETGRRTHGLVWDGSGVHPQGPG